MVTGRWRLKSGILQKTAEKKCIVEKFFEKIKPSVLSININISYSNKTSVEATRIRRAPLLSTTLFVKLVLKQGDRQIFPRRELLRHLCCTEIVDFSIWKIVVPSAIFAVVIIAIKFFGGDFGWLLSITSMVLLGVAEALSSLLTRETSQDRNKCIEESLETIHVNKSFSQYILEPVVEAIEAGVEYTSSCRYSPCYADIITSLNYYKITVKHGKNSSIIKMKPVIP